MEIVRSFSWDDHGNPVMILRRRGQIKTAYIIDKYPTRSFAIPLNDAWLYSEEHNPEGFIQNMATVCSFLCDLFDLGLPTPRRMAELATIIQEGLDELVKMPPEPTKRVTIGEVTISIGNEKDGFETHTNDLVVAKPIGRA